MRDQLNTTIQGILQVPIQVHAPDAAQYNNNTLTYASSGDVVGFSIWQAIMSSQFYMNYKKMYDSVKLNGFRCKITGNSAASLTLASGLSSVTTAVAWDRNGISGLVFRQGAVPDQAGTLPKTPVPFMRPGTIANTGPARVNRLLSYGSVKQKPWSPGNAFTQYISGYAQTAQETQQWIPTEKLDVTYVSKQAGQNLQWHVGFPSGLAYAGDRLTSTVSDVSIPYTGGSVAFDPVVMLGVFDVPVANPASDPVFTFSVEYKVDVSFRGTRSGLAINMGAVPEEQMDQVLQTLSATVPSGETMNLVPDEGVLWNQATLVGGLPTVYERVGVDQVVPNPEVVGGYTVTLLPHTTEVYGNDVAPEAFVITALPDTHWTPPPVVGPAYARTTVFYEPVKQEPVYSPLERTFIANGHYTGNGVFSGYDLTVNVPGQYLKRTISAVNVMMNTAADEQQSFADFNKAPDVNPGSVTVRPGQYLVLVEVSALAYFLTFRYENTADSQQPLTAGAYYYVGNYDTANQNFPWRAILVDEDGVEFSGYSFYDNNEAVPWNMLSTEVVDFVEPM